MLSRIWLSLALHALFLCAAHAAKPKDEFKGWTCDDMTPNLCDDLQVTTGSFPSTRGGSFHVHFWRYATANLDKDTFPVVVINGGPGLAHDCDLPLRQLACRGREVIFYDQGGTGMSSLPPNKTVADDFNFLLDSSYYANEELPALIKALKLDYYHIVASSWGTMMAMQSVIHERDPKLLSLSLNGPIPRASDWIDLSWDPVEGSIGTLPVYIKERMRAIEAAQDFDSREMQQISTVVFANFYSRNGLFPDCLAKSIGNSNEEVGVGLWGAIDFLNITGTIKDFDIWPDIKNGSLNEIPTLLMSGQYDMVRPIVVNELYETMSLSEKILFPESGHASVYDATEELLNGIHGFLNRVEIAETVEGAMFIPKRHGEYKAEEDAPSGIVLQSIVAVIVIVVTFLLGAVVGKFYGSRKDGQYTQIM